VVLRGVTVLAIILSRGLDKGVGRRPSGRRIGAPAPSRAYYALFDNFRLTFVSGAGLVKRDETGTMTLEIENCHENQ
jgi:hypothetical protein